ncbi:transient receptor potential cation channel subfamily A member 1-like isoform X4 [Rhopilema esculentum]|uniref:transient receptor potential cation channel subfamily A member 1-like isoform X4 n=1 Tax=Rhopilema esculentum TaxID=499914 RepID=UPI0031D8F03A
MDKKAEAGKANAGFEMEEQRNDRRSENVNPHHGKVGFEHFGEPHSRKQSSIDDIKQQISRTIALNVVNQWKEYCSERRAEKNKTAVYRKGPAPIEDSESLKKAINKSTYGTLDSDVEELEFEENRVKNGGVGTLGRGKKSGKKGFGGSSLASCRALIVYFSKLAKTRDEEELIDLNFVESLLQSGADINFSDQHGQTIMHEIARAWHPDVAKFAIQNNADVNKADLFGRTPLHLAAAVDYDEMVEFLVQRGADMNAITKGENQTPMHYAAKNNATSTLKTLLNLGAFINARDYKMRTPLFVAAESARSEAARFLIEHGAPVGVYDDSGTPCLSLMIEKMPHIAIEAVEQFHNIDRAFRKHFFYLNYLEKDYKYLDDPEPKTNREKREKKEKEKEEKRIMKEKGMKKPKKEKTFAKVPIEVILQYNQLDLIMHPVFQKLLDVKWNLFGKWGTFGLVAINLFYTLIWTVLGIFLPRHGEKYYSPISETWWRLVLEVFGVLMTVYFIFSEIRQVRQEERNYNQWRQWRTRQVERDIDYCHPRWPEEKKYLDSELQQIRTYQRTYFRDPWNIFEWITYGVVLTLVITRMMAVFSSNKTAEQIHPGAYAMGLIVIWLRFMRSCRAFRSLGPFIAILGSVIADTLKFAFLFFEFFIPYTVGFWILFGGPVHGKQMGENKKDWQNFNDLVFSVWQMTLIGDFNWDGLVAVNRLMAQMLVGTYFALTGVVCLNLYIALLSDTFSRVYAQAQANAVMQQAQLVLLVEKSLPKKKKVKFGHYMKSECGPLEVYSRDEGNSPDDHENDMFDKVVRQICNRVDQLEDRLKGAVGRWKMGDDGSRTGNATPSWRGSGFLGPGGGGHGGGPGGGGPGGGGPGHGPGNEQLYQLLDTQNKQMGGIRQELEEVKQLMFKMMKISPIPSAPSKSTVQMPGEPTIDEIRLVPSSSHNVSEQERRQTFPRRNSSNQQFIPQGNVNQPFIPQGNNFFGSHPQRTPSDSRDGYGDQRGRSGPRARNKPVSSSRDSFADSKSGYMTEPDQGGQGKRRRRRGGRGKRGTSVEGDYDSDINSTVSEQMPMLDFQQQGKGGRRRGRGGKPLTGSWEDIRSETDA